MSSPLIILCPGQGAQTVGMGKAWYDASPEARAVFDEADRLLGSRLGAPLSELCFSGPAERLNRTDVSQPAIFTCGIACWRGLLARWGMGEGEANLGAVLGLSLGEYTALTIAGAMSFADGLELVTLRGRAMQDAAEMSPSAAGQGANATANSANAPAAGPNASPAGGMVALIGADESQARAVCAQTLDGHPGEVLVCANFNAPGQIVLSGTFAACRRAVDVASAAGLRGTLLQVAGAFHSPLMRPAAERLEAALARTAIVAPRVPVYSNVTASPHAPHDPHTPQVAIAAPDSIRRRLVEQLTNPVRWAESCAAVAAAFAPALSPAKTGTEAAWHELCPGKTLAGLMRRIDKTVKVQSEDAPAPAA